MSTNLTRRLQRLEVPRSGTAVVCLEVDAEGAERVLWRVPCRNPNCELVIRIPPAGDPIISIEEMGKREKTIFN